MKKKQFNALDTVRCKEREMALTRQALKPPKCAAWFSKSTKIIFYIFETDCFEIYNLVKKKISMRAITRTKGEHQD